MLRHFTRVDGNCGVGRPGASMTYVRTGDTLHLDTEVEEEARIAEDLDGAPGWVESGDDGGALASRADRPSRAGEADPTVSYVDPLSDAQSVDAPPDPEATDDDPGEDA